MIVSSRVINSDARVSGDHDTVDSLLIAQYGHAYGRSSSDLPSILKRSCNSLTGFPFYSSADFWKANLTGESSPFLKLDRWIIMINATPLFMSIQN